LVSILICPENLENEQMELKSNAKNKQLLYKFIPFFVAQQPKSALGRLIVEVSRSHTIKHTHTDTHSVESLYTSDQPLAETATYTSHSKHTTTYIQHYNAARLLMHCCHRKATMYSVSLSSM